jgi:ParB family transcriptional regulator, chromosome partitioning protein
LDEVPSSDQRENNISNINDLAFYHLIRWSLDYVPRVSLSHHDCLDAFAHTDEPPASYQGVEQQAKRLADALALADDEDEESTGWQLLRYSDKDATTLYEAVKALSDEDLDRLHLLLTVLAFGQGDCSRLDTGDTLFNRVACDLGVDMRSCWRPDMDFLSRRTREQLVPIAAESGYTERSGYPSRLKKSHIPSD